MSKVDWSLAPDDATHFGPSTKDWEPCWMKKIGNHWYGWLYPTDTKWDYLADASSNQSRISMLVKRPQPKPWSGPEDGLPPVGAVCEVREPNNYSAFQDWSKCTISAHNIGSNGRPQVCAVDDRGDFAIFYPEIDPVEFRAIPSAADLRETAIRELMDIAQVDCRVTAARLVDAGFKREVV